MMKYFILYNFLCEVIFLASVVNRTIQAPDMEAGSSCDSPPPNKEYPLRILWEIQVNCENSGIAWGPQEVVSLGADILRSAKESNPLP